MKYQANPVSVDARRIIGIGPALDGGEGAEAGSIPLLLEGGDAVVATPAMMARMTPAEGDYWVMQEDGYTYLNPRDVFERKYSLVASGLTIVALAFKQKLDIGVKFAGISADGLAIEPILHTSATLDELDVRRERRDFMRMFGDPIFAALLASLQRLSKA